MKPDFEDEGVALYCGELADLAPITQVGRSTACEAVSASANLSIFSRNGAWTAPILSVFCVFHFINKMRAVPSLRTASTTCNEATLSMNSIMRRPVTEFQILEAIIRLVSITVMDNFCRKQRPSKMLLHNYTMLISSGVFAPNLRTEDHISGVSGNSYPCFKIRAFRADTMTLIKGFHNVE